MSMRSVWAAFSLTLGLGGLGACAQEVDDLPVPRAWSYGSAEVSVVEAPAGATRPAPRAPEPAAVHSDAPGTFARARGSLGRTLTSLLGSDDRTVAAESTGTRHR